MITCGRRSARALAFIACSKGRRQMRRLFTGSRPRTVCCERPVNMLSSSADQGAWEVAPMPPATPDLTGDPSPSSDLVTGWFRSSTFLTWVGRSCLAVASVPWGVHWGWLLQR